jgi:lauroyl/myristoyl acyltransferase
VKEAILVKLFSLLRWLMRHLPPETMLALSAWVGKQTGARLERDRGIARTHLAYAFPQGDPRESNDPPQDAERSREALLDDVFSHFGESVGELFIVDRYFHDTSGVDNVQRTADTFGDDGTFQHFGSSGEGHIRTVLAQGKGAVAVSGHLGCFELLAAFYVQCGVPLSVIGRMPNYPILATLLDSLRSDYGVTTLWREDPSAMRNIIRALTAGEVVAALIDQDIDLDNVYSDFLGLPAAYPRLLIEVAVKRDIPVLTSFIYRRGRMDHFIETEPIEYDAKDPNAINHIIAVFSSRLENLLERYPEQWPWWHRRWRRQPGFDYKLNPDSLPSTTAYLEWIRQKTRTTASSSR